MMDKIGHVAIIQIILMSGLIGIIMVSPEAASQYIPHDPISIEGDADFAAQAVSEGWPGNGTEGNPYVIKGYDIHPNLYGVEIRSTTATFIIRDLQIKNGVELNHCGIYLDNVTNGIIENCLVENNINGLILSFSNHNHIGDNKILSNHHNGISLFNSGQNIISNNNISLNGLGGIFITDSFQDDFIGNSVLNNGRGIQISLSSGVNIVNNTVIRNNISLSSSTGINITGNSINEGGIIIGGNYLKHWNTHSIDPTNTVNGRSIYYWKNQKEGIVPAYAGQVILTNCSEIKIEKQELNNCHVGIVLGFSTNNSIISNIISSNSKHGIYLYASCDNKIISNTIIDSGWSIHLYNSKGNTIKDNIISNTIFSLKYMGIHLQYSDGNNITGNNASNNWAGIYLSSSSGNNITNNNVSNNDDGIFLNAYCYWNNFTYNTIFQNTDFGIHIYGSSNNVFHHNNIIDNTKQLNKYRNENIWDDGNGEGNYWDDYNGSDDDGDGVGDTDLPHQDVDYYPSMKLFEVEEKAGDEITINEKDFIFSEKLLIGLITLLILIIAIILTLQKRKTAKTPPETESHQNS